MAISKQYPQFFNGSSQPSDARIYGKTLKSGERRPLKNTGRNINPSLNSNLTSTIEEIKKQNLNKKTKEGITTRQKIGMKEEGKKN
uniref:Uncharacterized protein n=1 Tax=Rhizophora mucronata TaxID=61149 RepID=A0A2P2KHG7_RHIMU